MATATALAPTPLSSGSGDRVTAALAKTKPIFAETGSTAAMRRTRATRKASTAELVNQAASSAFLEAVQGVAGGMNKRGERLQTLQAQRSKLVEAKNGLNKEMRQIRKGNKKSDKVLRKKATIDLVRELSLRLGAGATPMADADTDIEPSAEENPPTSG